MSTTLANLSVSLGNPLKFDGLDHGNLAKIDKFYSCVTCGHLYWNGAHHGRFTKQIGDLFDAKLAKSNKPIGETKELVDDEPEQVDWNTSQQAASGSGGNTYAHCRVDDDDDYDEDVDYC